MSVTQNPTDTWTYVASLEELKEAKVKVVKGGRYGIALFYDKGEVRALDNRCPHLGFPLHLGSVDDGILTCHWHNARFDLCTGGTFDPFADDVPVYQTEVRGDEVWLDLSSNNGRAVDKALARLGEGMRQTIDLVIAKSVATLLDHQVKPERIVQEGALHGARFRSAGWRSGMTILTAMANALDSMDEGDRIHGLYQGLRHIARDCQGQEPSFRQTPLPDRTLDGETLERWFRRMIETRSVEGAERALLTAIQNGVSGEDLACMLFRACTDRFYRDGGHVLDFSNKACEVLDQIGWDHADEILPTLVSQLAMSQRSEETNPWKHPIDLVTPLKELFEKLPEAFAQGKTKVWDNAGPLVDQLLSDDILTTFHAIFEAIRSGATGPQLGRALAFAAANRIARFNMKNDFDDWIAVAHTFTYSNALQKALTRVDDPLIVRGVFHGAVAVYMDRFFNVPAARLPQAPLNGEAVRLDNFDRDFLEVLDRRQSVAEAATIVHRFLKGGGDDRLLWRTLAKALLQEDAEFHTYQVFEAGYQQYRGWDVQDPAFARVDRGLIPIAVARYLASHAPTMRQSAYIADVARRLQRGEALDTVEAAGTT